MADSLKRRNDTSDCVTSRKFLSIWAIVCFPRIAQITWNWFVSFSSSPYRHYCSLISVRHTSANIYGHLLHLHVYFQRQSDIYIYSYTSSFISPASTWIDSFLLNCCWYSDALQTMKSYRHQIYKCRLDIKLLEPRLFCVSDGVGISSREDWNGWASHFISCDISTEGILRYWLRSSQAKEYGVPVNSLSSEVWMWSRAELMRSLAEWCTCDSIKQLSR